ncbi:MAG TPA: tRNA (adenosine(37)-N6)-threonylcarbamoyltransferase complex dimerization subunit type 1 TsaB [Polyangiaceae bacterium]
MRILGIETSTRRGSVALFDGGRVVLALEHEKPNAHAEQLFPLVTRLFAESGVDKRSLDRVAVGTGPGSFTGLRVGIALGEGIALGIGVPLVGIGSLEALALSPEGDRPRIAVLDAGRGELFVAAYAAGGDELVAPSALTPDAARARCASIDALRGALLVGEGAGLLGGEFDVAVGSGFDLPHARSLVTLAAGRAPERSPADPIYVRGPGATLPELPPSPLANER